ncbi:hypothetical protein ACOSQ3_011564 [Xanthoceras sorbifolium]
MAHSLKDLESLDGGSFERIRQQTREEANGDEKLASDMLTERILTAFIVKLQEGPEGPDPQHDHHLLQEVRDLSAGSHDDHDGLPREVRDLIESLNGSDLKFLMEKQITWTDLNPKENRLLVAQRLIGEEFLTGEEKKELKQGRGLGVTVIEPCLEITPNLQLKEWPMRKRLYFALIGNWSSIAENKKNHLEPGCMVKLWSFRKESSLYFVLVKA